MAQQVTNSDPQEDQPIAGRIVGGAGEHVENVAQQVESAAIEATEFASDNVLGRLIGYVRAGKNILEGGLQGALNIEKSTSDALLKELDDLREKAEQEIAQAGSRGSS